MKFAVRPPLQLPLAAKTQGQKRLGPALRVAVKCDCLAANGVLRACLQGNTHQ
jgi:hypothetical protein